MAITEDDELGGPHPNDYHDNETPSFDESMLQAEDDQYKELHTTERVPLKTGGEEIVRDMTPFSERPTSAGTVFSGNVEFDDADADDNLLTILTTSPKKLNQTQDTSDDASTAPSRLLSRRETSPEPQAGADFSFFRATRGQMDLTGNRRRLAAGAGQPETSNGQGWQHQVTSTDHDTGPNMLLPEPVTAPQRQHATEKESTQLSLEDAEPRGLATDPKKRRKKPKRRQDSTLREQHEQDLSISGPLMEPQHVFAEPVPQIEMEEPDAVLHVAQPQADDWSLASRAPLPAPDDTRQANGSWSPHNQLYEDLEAAAQRQQTDEGSSITPPPRSRPNYAQSTLEAAAQPQHMEQEFPVSPHPQSRPCSVHSTRPSPEPLIPVAQASYEEESQHVDREMTVGGGMPFDGGARQSMSAGATRRKGRKSRTQPPVAGSVPTKVNDLIHILAYEARKVEEANAADLQAIQHEKEEQLQAAHQARQQLQEELDAVLEEKEHLAATLDKHTAKLKKYDSQFPRLKKFVDGLGTDLDKLRHDSNAVRRRSEELLDGHNDSRQEHSALIEDVRQASEHALQVRNKALENCRELQSDLDAATLRTDYLSQQLSEKAGMLVEERDSRARLERLLSSVTQSDEAIMKSLKSNADAILDKLYEVHATLEKGQADDTVTELLQQTFAVVQGATSDTTEAVDQIASVKGLVETISERLSSHVEESTATAFDPVPFAATFQTNLSEAVSKLRTEVSHKESLLQQEADHRETISSLREQLKASEARVNDINAHFATSQQAAAELRQHNNALQTKLATARFTPPPASDPKRQPSDESVAEYELTKCALQSARAEMASKSEEIRSPTSRNANIQDQMTSLKSRLDQLKTQAVDFERERESLIRKAKHDEERIRQEMSGHVEQVELKLKSDAKNDMKRLCSERIRLQDQVKSLKETLKACNAQIKLLEQDQSAYASTQQELDRTKKVVDAQKHEIANLQASLSKLHNAVDREKVVSEQYAALSARLTAEQGKVEAAVAEKLSMSKEVGNLQRSLSDAQRLEREARSELEKKRLGNDASLKALEREVADAKDEAERAAAGQKLLKASCDKAVKDEQSKAERQKASFQQALSESQAETRAEKAAHDEYQVQVNNSWQQTQEIHDQQKAESNRQLTEMEAELRKAKEVATDLRTKTDAAVEVKQMALLDQRKQMEHRAETAEANLSQVEPVRPRKKVDRNTNTLVEVNPIPVPEVIRPDSRRAASAGSRPPSAGPVVEETQLASDPFAVHPDDIRSAQMSLSIGAYDMLAGREEDLTQRPQIVEETQQEDTQSTFAPLYGSFPSSQHFDTRKIVSAVAPSPFFASSHKDVLDYRPTADFTIYDDSQQADSSMDAARALKETTTSSSLYWSQAEKDKYTYKPPVPLSNSASKRLRPADDSSHTLGFAHSYGPRDDMSSTFRQQTPQIGDGGGRAALKGTLSSHSSSPGFVHDSQTNNRRQSTYQSTNNSAGKRKASRNSSYNTADPRLVARNQAQAQKRKAEGQVVEGYEAERKKRLPIDIGVGGRALRSSAQSASNSLSMFPPRSSGSRESSQHGSSLPRGPSHMRTLAGASSRNTRSTKKMSKHDEYAARFSQELDGR